jgi:nucleoside-triphosphatase THEP1
MSPLKLFLTGNPGCGKTTLVRRVDDALAGEVAMTGFLTEEIREGRKRKGFRGTTIDGREFVLAHVDSESEIRVGAYGVEREGLESVGVPSLTPGSDTRLVVVDEVGKMESFSKPFRDAIEGLLAGDKPVLGTVAAQGVGFVKRVRRDPRVTLLTVSPRSRDAMVGEVLRRLARAGIEPSRTAKCTARRSAPVGAEG